MLADGPRFLVCWEFHRLFFFYMRMTSLVRSLWKQLCERASSQDMSGAAKDTKRCFGVTGDMHGSM